MSKVPSKPRVWYFDTCTLMTMQASADLNSLLKANLANEYVVLLVEVVEELERLADFKDRPGLLANAALLDLAWLGDPAPAEDFASAEAIVEWQSEVAQGRTLKHAFEHWAESCVIASAATEPVEHGAVLFLSEDYSARITVNGAHDLGHCTPLSVHRYMFELVQDKTLPASKALAIAEELHRAGRGPECVLGDFTNASPRGLGIAGQP